jgi:hypothetical protein
MDGIVEEITLISQMTQNQNQNDEDLDKEELHHKRDKHHLIIR